MCVGVCVCVCVCVGVCVGVGVCVCVCVVGGCGDGVAVGEHARIVDSGGQYVAGGSIPRGRYTTPLDSRDLTPLT